MDGFRREISQDSVRRGGKHFIGPLTNTHVLTCVKNSIPFRLPKVLVDLGIEVSDKDVVMIQYLR